MKIFSTYSIKIKHYNHIFKETVRCYRLAVDFFVEIALKEWETLQEIPSLNLRQSCMEQLCVRTSKRPMPLYPFEDARKVFYKFPCYLRRAAINEALGKVSSYKSNLENWENTPVVSRGKMPSKPCAGNVYPVLYRKAMYQRENPYQASIKVFTRNTWDWLTVDLNKGDVDYITHHCLSRKECAPTLQKRGHEWFLDFPFEENVKLATTPIEDTIAIAVDLGINNACACSAMLADGTIVARKILNLPTEKDSLNHAINRIKKAQRVGNHKMPRLWAKAKGINQHIAVLTAQYIIDFAILYSADVIVFEHLDLKGKKKGGKKQKLHLWKAQTVQALVTHKAHRYGMRVSRVNAWGTSALAFDGSGRVERGTYLQDGIEKYNYSICTFTTGKIYNCDLNASYNIGARYFIRERLKSLSETIRLGIEAKVPQCTKRTTCTLSDLISLNAVMGA